MTNDATVVDSAVVVVVDSVVVVFVVPGCTPRLSLSLLTSSHDPKHLSGPQTSKK